MMATSEEARRGPDLPGRAARLRDAPGATIGCPSPCRSCSPDPPSPPDR